MDFNEVSHRLMAFDHLFERADDREKKLLSWGHVPNSLKERYNELMKLYKTKNLTDRINYDNTKLNLLLLDTWFAKHPEKVAGKATETTSLHFPVQIKGTREDVEQMFSFLDKPKAATSKKVKLANAKAKAQKQRLTILSL